MNSLSLFRRSCRIVAAACLAGAMASVGAQTSLTPGATTPSNTGGGTAAAEGQGVDQSGTGRPIRLRQPGSTGAQGEDQPAGTPPTAVPGQPGQPRPLVGDAGPYVPGEFERFVQQLAGFKQLVRRFGADLVTGTQDLPSTEVSPLVPDDYVVGPGDEVLVTLWGSVDAELRLMVDRAGRISIPRVGTVQVSGLRAAEVPEVVNRRVAQVFRNFQSSVSLGQLRGIRIFVTGFVQKPGTYAVSSLSSIVSAVMRAGGPSPAGSFRNIELRRGSTLVTRFDLYDLLLRGDRSGDRILQAGDVVHVGAVGPQVGFIGSVNMPAVLELRPGEALVDALGMVGGFTAVADRTRLAVERLRDRNVGRVNELALPQDASAVLSDGDVLRAFSAVDTVLPSQQQSKRVKIEGEVVRPAEYILPAGSSVRDAIRAAGGYTSAAYVYAAELTRESVQRTQQENYDRALRDLETDMAKASSTQRVTSAEEASAQAARVSGTNRLVERLRTLRPNGRIVLQLPADATDLPDLALEDGDRILVPSRPTTVGVFGSVFNAATYLHSPGRTIGDYLRLAGGPTKGADDSSIFVVRANGNVVSGRQSASFFNRSGGISELPSEPGDTVFVPEEMDKTTFVQAAKDWTQILYQFGLGIAGLKVLSN